MAYWARCAALAATCAVVVHAHTVITYPGWRGNNLGVTDAYPYGMQRGYPCACFFFVLETTLVWSIVAFLSCCRHSVKGGASVMWAQADYCLLERISIDLIHPNLIYLSCSPLAKPLSFPLHKLVLLTTLQVAVWPPQRTVPNGP